jgi:hypothetical protein
MQSGVKQGSGGPGLGAIVPGVRFRARFGMFRLIRGILFVATPQVVGRRPDPDGQMLEDLRGRSGDDR